MSVHDHNLVPSAEDFIHMDAWKTALTRPASPSIDVVSAPKLIGQNVIIGTFENEYDVTIEMISGKLCIGKINNTPPKTKNFKKHCKVLFHEENVLRVKES